MMEKSAEPVTPMSFLLRLRSLYPQFAQQNPPDSGEYMQQDAEECWTQLLYTLKETLQVSSLTSCSLHYVHRLPKLSLTIRLWRRKRF